MNHKYFPFIALLMFTVLAVPNCLMAQTQTTGAVMGTVTDQTGAAIPNAQVTLKDTTKGTTLQTTTNTTGAYQFQLLTPSNYSLSVSAPAFQTATRLFDVVVGQISTINVPLRVASAEQQVVVTEGAPLIQVQSANVGTTLTALQASQLPNPGNDITATAQVAPGSMMNSLGGYGNFSSYGMSATSNLFTLDGMADNDPFFNINNSGATNLLLGQNEIQEVSVVGNAYTAQYGGLAGANVNYVTKSGSNSFHGNANYFWNGRVMNANGWFNKNSGAPRPFSNANQWGGSLGGPIVKDKAFFFFDTEGLYVSLPISVQANIPSPAFEQAVLGGLPPTLVPFYQNMFKLYNTSSGAARASDVLPPGVSDSGVPTGDGCSNFAGIGTAPCALQFRSTASSKTHETLFSGRVDYNFSDSDHIFVRFQTDHGVQASYTDPIQPIFNAVSTQPEYQGQIEWTHTLSSTAVNQFILAGQWYSALFAPSNLSDTLKVFPTSLNFGDGSLTALGGIDWLWPQGRNVTQYQFSDDFSKERGRHNLRFGFNFRRNDVSDHDYGLFTAGLTTVLTLNDFANGGITGDSIQQNFPTSLNQPMALYSLGFYAQDEWRVKRNFTFTYGLRAEHFSNPVCQTNCFARLTGPFSEVSHDVSQPYNQAILINQKQALQSVTNIAWEPRIGIAWQPIGSDTVIRAGFGIFADQFPATVVDNLSSNPPLLNSFIVGNQFLTDSSAVPNLFSVAAGSNQAFINGFHAGQTFGEISAADPAFVPPALFTTDRHTHVPIYYKWSLGVERKFGANDSVNVEYVGNRGTHEVAPIYTMNAFCDPVTCPGGFIGLNSVPPDARFGTVANFSSVAISNYNGITISATHRYSSGLIQANYTYSHALDEVSNGGFLNFSSGNFGATNWSAINPPNPNCIRCMYGPADYDVRHYFSLNYVWQLPIRDLTFGHGPNMLLNGWQVSGTLFIRSGLPFTVVDLASSAALAADNFGAPPTNNQVFASVLKPGVPSCGAGNAFGGPNAVPCLQAANFAPVIDPVTGVGTFGNQGRNRFRGPGYWNSDFTIIKYTNIPGWEQGQLGIGFQFFNVFNHPNFDNPVSNVAATQFGSSIRALSPPTTILGSVLGGDASPREIQLTARLRFLVDPYVP